MRKIGHGIGEWLETHWVKPAYAGGLLCGLSVFFLAAATNTLAGWLYTMSGISFALLAIAAILPGRSLRPLRVYRRPIEPVSAGDRLTIEIEIENPTHQPITWLQISDGLPYILGQPQVKSIEVIPPENRYVWAYYHPTQRRGVYRWHEIQLKTAAPLGLFWCRRSREAKAIAIVYPTVLPLTQCPLIDRIGQKESQQFESDRQSLMATEGITRTLRLYRFGDPTRLIHWRNSARYGELVVRELEIFKGSPEIIISLDSASTWHPDFFEQAVIAAASLYFYACRTQINAKLWTAGTGLIHGHRVVLEALAAVNFGEDTTTPNLPSRPLVWITQNPLTLNTLPSGSTTVLWPSPPQSVGKKSPSHRPLTQSEIRKDRPHLEIDPDQPLQVQLQAAPK